jgi:hypothetical protein
MTFTASTSGTHSTGLTLRRTTHTKNDATRVENQYTTAQLTATLGPLPQFYLPAFSLQFVYYRRWFVEEKKKHYEYISMDQQLVCLQSCSVLSLSVFGYSAFMQVFFQHLGFFFWLCLAMYYLLRHSTGIGYSLSLLQLLFRLGGIVTRYSV